MDGRVVRPETPGEDFHRGKGMTRVKIASAVRVK